MKRFAAALLLLCGLAAPAGAAGFADWAAIVVAGDNRAHSEAPSEVFDNARRDVATQLQRMGFAPGNIRTLSVQPGKYPGQGAGQTSIANFSNTLWDVANSAKGGCLIYFTSHGTPQGIIAGTAFLAPDRMAAIINNACGSRPTVALIAACYSGIFVEPLKAPNRMIFTAARPDRPSFGCGEQDTYTFFDTCMLQAMPQAKDFQNLAQMVAFCVGQREAEYKIPYNSEPQLFVGESVASQLPPFH